MNTKLVLFLSCILFSARTLSAQGTTFSYQGRLSDNGAPANGRYDMVFYLCDTPGVGGQLANLGIPSVPVSNGLFNVTLDFGANFPGADRWLEITVQTNGAATFTTLSPRQKLTPTPYAIHAGNATLLSGLGTNALAPATGSSAYVAKAGDAMTGTLNLPANGLAAGGNQLVLSGGRVGIGTTNPDSKIHVVGETTLQGNQNAIKYMDSAGTVRFLMGLRNDLVPTNDFLFYSYGGNWVFANNGGKVGIATTTPQATLDVNGGMKASRALRFEESGIGGGAAEKIYTDALLNDAHLILGARSRDDLVIRRESGNVGIGTLIPATKLDVSVSSANTTLSSEVGMLQLGNANGTANNFEGILFKESHGNPIAGILGMNIEHGAASISTAGDLLFTTKQVGSGGFPVERMRINSLGNVGIGTTSPENKLHVASGWVQIDRGYGAGSDLRTVGGWYRPNFGLAIPHTSEYGSLNFLAHPSGFAPHFVFRSSLDNSAWMVISDGNVGIGTTIPTARLHVSYGGVDQLWLHNSVSGGRHVALSVGDAGYGENLFMVRDRGPTGTSDAIRFAVGLDGSANSFFNSGNVGIGTTAPGFKLHVSGSAQDVARFQSSSGTSRISLDPTGAGGRRWAIESTGGSFNIGDVTANADRLFINASGNVGIGTTSPTAKLEINGSIKCTGSGNSVTTPVLTITGGSDVAEPFQMSGSDIPKGAVVVIDDENAGRLKMSERAYDTRVAGIVSGAGGVQPGITLSQQGVLEGGQHVALSGRVYVQADATDAPIKPGDLLTTAATPGHAMKVKDHAQAQGAILGKAMSALKEGKGLVLVLVTLQ